MASIAFNALMSENIAFQAVRTLTGICLHASNLYHYLCYDYVNLQGVIHC